MIGFGLKVELLVVKHPYETIVFVTANIPREPTVVERIMDEAGLLFAERGYDGVSVRQLTANAHVNLAAVNYYFGSKEGLYSEIIRRRIRPVNAARLA